MLSASLAVATPTSEPLPDGFSLIERNGWSAESNSQQDTNPSKNTHASKVLDNNVKENYAAIWQDEFTMSEAECEMPLYDRIESAITRAKARIDSGDGKDYKMLKELVSYISGKYEYEGYENQYGRNSSEAEAVVSNINFALSNLEKIDSGELSTELATYKSGEIWLDTLGSKISAHGGQIIQQGDTYYWYGEDNKVSYWLTTGVSCYSSKDLKNWTYEGLAFKVFDDGTEERQFTDEFMTDSLLGTHGRIERPKVIYNEKNNNYVMWMHLESNDSYNMSAMGVAVASSPTGPFIWQWYGRPVCDSYVISDSKHQFFRDMNLFVEDDKKAYLFASSENNQLMYQVRLDDDYTWIDADDLESSGTTENEIQPGKVITPDMRIGEEKNGGYIGSKYTYDKKSFTRYQLASGGAVKLQKKQDESGADAKDENGMQIYVSTREDGLLCLPEYENGRWARVGCNAPDENKVPGKTETTVDNSITTQREAPAPIKIDGKYYLVTSSLSGWKANPSLTQVADSIFGPWTATGNPMTGSGPANNGQWSQAADIQSSFNSQSTCILKLSNGEYMYMGDRWKNGVYETSNSLGTFPDVDVKASTYVWLPITFESDGQYGDNTLKVRWRDSWSFDALGEAAENLKIYGTEPYVYGNLYLPTELGDGVTVTWQTSDAGTITTTGEVTRPEADKKVTLTATVSKGDQSVKKIFNVTVKAKAAARTDSAYLFVHFAGESTPRSADDEQIYFALSDDGMNWEKVHGGKPVLTSTLGTTGVRDPHIVRSPEGDKFYMIATDLSIYNNNNWTAAQTNGSKSIMVWESNDLVNWTDQRMVEIAPDDAGCVWAPESFYDEDTGSYMVYWASKVGGKQKIYYSETRDFVNFTEPQIYVEKENDVIDSTIVKDNGIYYRFSKDETTKKVILEKSNKLRGTYDKVNEFNVDIESEGPTCFKRADGKWELLVDGLGSNSGYKAYVSNDIASGKFTQDTSFSTPYEFRHGTVIPISAEERDAIKAAYNTSGEITQTASTTQSLGALRNNTIGSNMELNIDEFKLYNRALSYKEVTGNDEPELDYTLTVKNEKGVDIQDGMFGLFFEDINYAADGGLYAEMIENRSFEAIKNNGGASTAFDGSYGWTAENGTLEIKDSGGLNENNPHYAAFTSNGAGGCLKNQAYEGLYLTGGETYKMSFYAKAAVPTTVTASIGNAAAEVAVSGNEWKKYETELTAASDQNKAEFKLTLGAAGETDFDMISLMPESAACGVFRKDLADKLKALDPGFLRFPGGCVVEGYNLTNAYNWKDSVGDISERKQNWNLWASQTNSGLDGGYKHYNQTLGLGFYEYFLLCEYIGAKPLPVINMGLGCQFRGKDSVAINSGEFKQYIQDALDLIEFANSTDFEGSEWAALRKQMGHEEPFNLELLGIGNEQWETDGNDFRAKYEAFEAAIHEQYPDIKLIGTAGPDVTSSNYTSAWNWIREKAADNPDFVYAVDEHYYMTPEWFLENDGFYDNYNRDIKVFAGEYAARGANDNKPNNPQSNTLQSAIAEAAFMTGLERNADVVYMASYAPLFARDGYAQWSPDMIWFDGRSSYGTPSYYTQQMYSRNTGNYTLKSEVTGNTENNKLYQSVSHDEETGDIIIKLVNAESREGSVSIDLSALGISGKADITVLSGNGKAAYNSMSDPDNIVPKETKNADITAKYDYTLPANSFTVIRAHTRVSETASPEPPATATASPTEAPKPTATINPTEAPKPTATASPTGTPEPISLNVKIVQSGSKATAVYTVPSDENRALTGFFAEYKDGVLTEILSIPKLAVGENTLKFDYDDGYEYKAFIWDINLSPAVLPAVYNAR